MSLNYLYIFPIIHIKFKMLHENKDNNKYFLQQNKKCHKCVNKIKNSCKHVSPSKNIEVLYTNELVLVI